MTAGSCLHCGPRPVLRLPSVGAHLRKDQSVQNIRKHVLQPRAPRRRQQRPGRNMQGGVRALDAPMPFDFEHKAKNILAKQKRLKIGIVSFGNFGQFLARRLVQAGHDVLATSRADYRDAAAGMGVRYFMDPNDFCEEHPEVVIFACSILSLGTVLGALPVQRLRRSTLFVDVLSVKEFPKRLMLSLLPPEVDILCTHPMFGPDSGKASWQGLNLMFERVRIGGQPERRQRADNFLQFFQAEGCAMVEMSCEDHDRIAASTQFITHTVGRVLGAMDLASTRIDTRGFTSLLSLVDNTTHDSFDLYYGLFMYNANATEELERLERAFDSVKKQLFTRLHAVARQQLFQQAPEVPVPDPWAHDLRTTLTSPGPLHGEAAGLGSASALPGEGVSSSSSTTGNQGAAALNGSGGGEGAGANAVVH